MDKPVVSLSTEGFTLYLSAKGKAWCKVWLKTDDEEYYLGAEQGAIIIDRLYAALDGVRGRILGKDGDIELSGVVTLSEKHASVYIGDVEDNIYMYIRDSEAQPIARILLSLQDVERWKEALHVGLETRGNAT